MTWKKFKEKCSKVSNCEIDFENNAIYYNPIKTLCQPEIIIIDGVSYCDIGTSKMWQIIKTINKLLRIK